MKKINVSFLRYVYTYAHKYNRTDVENEGNNVGSYEKSYISDLLQQFLKNGLEIMKKISTTSNAAKMLSCRNIYGH